MSGVNTRSVLARFGDNNWEKGEDFVKTFYIKKTCVRDGEELERAVRYGTVRSCRESEVRQNFAKDTKILRLSQKVFENKSGQVVEKTFGPHFVFV